MKIQLHFSGADCSIHLEPESKPEEALLGVVASHNSATVHVNTTDWDERRHEYGIHSIDLKLAKLPTSTVSEHLQRALS